MAYLFSWRMSSRDWISRLITAGKVFKLFLEGLRSPTTDMTSRVTLSGGRSVKVSA
jgi:hypothetical protein